LAPFFGFCRADTRLIDPGPAGNRRRVRLRSGLFLRFPRLKMGLHSRRQPCLITFTPRTAYG